MHIGKGILMLALLPEMNCWAVTILEYGVLRFFVRYKIYAEGSAWSVSLKYILSCGSMTLMITPRYEDFLSRGLIHKENFWPIPPTNFCKDIKSAVDWGNNNLSTAEKEAQRLMESLSMDRVYDYMFHLLFEYSKLQDFKPVPRAKWSCPSGLSTPSGS